MRLVVFSAALLLLVWSADALSVSTQKKAMDNHKCKTMCQRFGMKALGPEFASIHNPTECCTKCDEVYASLLQVEPHVPQPEAPKPKTNQPKGAEVVKR